jgi:hypothetical protein
MISITNTKVAITFAIGLILTQVSGLFTRIPWLFVASMLIGILLIMASMAYFVYHATYFLYDKMKGNK